MPPYRTPYHRLRKLSLTLLCWSLLLAPVAGNSPVRADASGEAPVASQPAERAADIDLRKTVQYLASDELEGRGVGTVGIDKAADYIAESFRKLGLQPPPGRDSYFQTFKMTTAVQPGAATALRMKSEGNDAAANEPARYELRKDFVPASFSAEKAFEGRLAFVGYGITSAERGYDDYVGLDVKGKVVLALRFEPHDAEGKSRFAGHGQDWSEEATLARKAKVAAEHGAVALVLVNPPSHHDGEGLIPFARMFRSDPSEVPIVQVQTAVADQWLKRAGSEQDLKALQAKIDAEGKPLGAVVGGGVSVGGTVEIERTQREVKNVVAVLPGKGPGAEEFVVIGAHYDHLGHGGPGSLLPQSNEIHNGADDNASGTGAMIELAERYAKAGPQARSMVFAAFTAEESGLIGSSHFVSDPPVPLDKTVFMLNLDMVGRVRDDTLYVGGGGTAASFESVLREADEASPLELKSIGKGGYGPSDHMSFALKKVPVMFFFSGAHADYHRPSDDADKVNYDGIKATVELTGDVVDKVLAAPREQYVDTNDAAGMHRGGDGGPRVSLGVVPDYGTEGVKGVRISGTVPGSPASAAGLKDGDVIVGFGANKIENLYDLTDELQKAKAGDKVKVRLLRDSQPVEVEATLVERKG